MKQLLMGIVFLLTAIKSPAEFQDVTNGSVVSAAIRPLEKEANIKDLQDALGITTFYFNVHRSSLSKGFSIYVELRTDGQPTRTLCETSADSDVLENQHVGLDVPVFISINPVGSADGEWIFSAKKLHFFIRLAGNRSTQNVVDNPFYKSKDGVGTWGTPMREKGSTTVFELMDNAARSGHVTKITVRFHEW